MFRATIIGNLTADAKSGVSDNGNHWLFATVAFTARIKLADGSFGDSPITTYVDIKAFNGLAKNGGPQLKKGMRVTVTGSVQEEDKTFKGETVRRLVITADDIAGSMLFAPKGSTPRQDDTDIEAEMNKAAAAVGTSTRFEDDDADEA